MVDKENAEGFGIGLIAGAAIGVAIGMLYAPRPGAETRMMVRDKIQDAEHRAEEIVSEARQKAKQIAEGARSRIAPKKSQAS